MTSKKESKKPIFMRFVLGGLAGATATTILNPVFLIQNIYPHKTYYNGINDIVMKKGITGLFKGLGQPLVHHTTFISLRVGVHSHLYGSYMQRYDEYPTFFWRVAMGLAGSTLSTLVGTPIDSIYEIVTNLRQHSLLTNKNVKTIIIDKIRKVDIRSFHIEHGRAVYNFVQIASYTHSKHLLKENFQMTENFNLHILAGLISCIAKGFTSIPMKYIQYRAQKINSYKQYGILFHENTNNDKFRKYLKDFNWNIMHTVLTLMVLEKFINLYSEYVLGLKNQDSLL